jgi:predicted DNA-binding transcriptional regulator YafY
MSEGVEMARSTFNRHRQAIEDIFGIYIECDRHNGHRYYIGNPGVLSEESVQNWMLSTLSVSNLISESLSLQKRILLEPVTSGQDFLEPIIEAMKKQQLLRIVYQRYGASEPRSFDAAPYCIKLYHQRWYLLARFVDGRFSTFCFDRMKQVELLDTTFVLDRNFDAEAYFNDSFGVVRIDSADPQCIVLRAFGTEADCLRDLPLHHSQREMATAPDHADFEYRLFPTLDFCGQILSRGCRLMVVSPATLVEQIKTMLNGALDNYR